jgi:hypothetical protein
MHKNSHLRSGLRALDFVFQSSVLASGFSLGQVSVYMTRQQYLKRFYLSLIIVMNDNIKQYIKHICNECCIHQCYKCDNDIVSQGSGKMLKLMSHQRENSTLKRQASLR